MRDIGTMAAELYLALKKNPGMEHEKVQVILSCFYSRATS
jgi:hypothetical protein